MGKPFHKSPAVPNRAPFRITNGNVQLSRVLLKHIGYSTQCSDHNWRNRHFLQLPQISYFFAKKLVLLGN